MNSNNFSIPEHFSTELLQYTLSFLDPKSLVCAGSVSKQWHCVENDKRTWKLLAEKIGRATKPDSYSWKEHCFTLKNWQKMKYNFYVDKMMSRSICQVGIVDGKHFEIRVSEKELYIENITDGKIIEIRSDLKNDLTCVTSLNGSFLALGTREGLIACVDVTTGNVLRHAVSCKLKSCMEASIVATETEFIMIISNDKFDKELIILSDQNEKVVDLPRHSRMILKCSGNYILVQTGESQFTRFNTSYDKDHPLFSETFVECLNDKYRYSSCSALSEKYTAFAEQNCIKIYGNDAEKKNLLQQIPLVGFQKKKVWEAWVSGDNWNMKIFDDWIFLQVGLQFVVFDIYTQRLILKIDDVRESKRIPVSTKISNFKVDSNLLIFENIPIVCEEFKLRPGLPSGPSVRYHLVYSFGAKKQIALTSKMQSAFQAVHGAVKPITIPIMSQMNGQLNNLSNSISDQFKAWFGKGKQ